jgi:hypothetical protein
MSSLGRAWHSAAPRVMSCLRSCTSFRRGLHHDASGSGFFDIPLRGRIGIGMDMTRAHGYRISAEVAPPPTHDRLLANFAARHAHLTPTQVYRAEGFLWLGPVIPAVSSQATSGPYESLRVWDDDDADEQGSEFSSYAMDEAESHLATLSDGSDTCAEHHIRGLSRVSRRRRAAGGRYNSARRAMHAKRRYSSGQARRERVRREHSSTRRQLRTQIRRKTKVAPERKPVNRYGGNESMDT